MQTLPFGSGEVPVQTCSGIDYGLSSPRVGYNPGGEGWHPRDFGYGHAVFNAVDIDNADDPSVPPPDLEGEGVTGEQVAVATVTAVFSAVALTTIAVILFKYYRIHEVFSRRSGYSTF